MTRKLESLGAGRTPTPSTNYSNMLFLRPTALTFFAVLFSQKEKSLTAFRPVLLNYQRFPAKILQLTHGFSLFSTQILPK